MSATESYRFVILDLSNTDNLNNSKKSDMKEETHIKGKHFTPNTIESKCYNCGSKNITRKKSEPWTTKWKCNDCNKEHFGIHADFMSGALNEDVYVTDKEQNI